MVFTKSKPQQFVDDRKVIGELQSTANRRMTALEGDKRFVETADQVEAELEELEPVASVLNPGHSAQGLTVAAAVFDNAALELLKTKCRSRYWLWYLLARLDTRTFPVDALAVARAQARAHADLTERGYGFATIAPQALIYSLKGMPPGFVLALWESGRILATGRGSTEFRVIHNPLLLED